jgi:molybdopterin synthase catalytic subunit
MVKLVDEPIDPAAIYSYICSAYSGSVVLHYSVVKRKAGSGKSTCILEYKAQGSSIMELEGIAGELERLWTLEDVLLIRRTGCLEVGEIISLVATSSPNSEDAFEACKFGISRIKKMTTITRIAKSAKIM